MSNVEFNKGFEQGQAELLKKLETLGIDINKLEAEKEANKIKQLDDMLVACKINKGTDHRLYLYKHGDKEVLISAYRDTYDSHCSIAMVQLV